jgi:hypothetical protein
VAPSVDAYFRSGISDIGHRSASGVYRSGFRSEFVNELFGANWW